MIMGLGGMGVCARCGVAISGDLQNIYIFTIKFLFCFIPQSLDNMAQDSKESFHSSFHFTLSILAPLISTLLSEFRQCVAALSPTTHLITDPFLTLSSLPYIQSVCKQNILSLILICFEMLFISRATSACID